MSQNCGQVWMDTFNEMNKYFSSTHQPTAVQLVTWNDYEEGTEIETGIDNCVSVGGSVSGSTVEWSISGGQENTIDHYSVFISTDSENLMKLADVAAGTHQLDLSSYNLAPQNYTLYVQAVGKPSILNKMSGAIPYTSTNRAPVAVLSVTPSSGTAPVAVTASAAGSSDPQGTIAATKIDFGDGTVMNAASASHTYSAAGTYTVTATVTDNLGVSSSTSVTVNVTAPVAQPFVITPVMPLNGTTVGTSVHFVATSSSPSSPVTALRIYVDNQSMYTVNATSLDTTLKLTAGSHYVVLQGWNQAGTVSKTPLNITVQASQPPVASLVLTPASGIGPLSVSASASGTEVNGSIASTSIDFGDGTVVNSASATHVYDASGTFNVTATVTDNNGATASSAATVSVMGVGVTPSRPARGSIDSTPVTISATAAAATPIVAMRVYVDNVAKYSLNSFSSTVATLNTSLEMARGTHFVVVQAWDTKGKVYKSPSTITVE
jgi:PKD repeat protein